MFINNFTFCNIEIICNNNCFVSSKKCQETEETQETHETRETETENTETKTKHKHKMSNNEVNCLYNVS